MYSQNQEEGIIINNLPKTGTVLDIGAYDGVVFSNSRALVEQGWKAVLVEPSPIVFTQLMKNTEDYKEQVTLVNCAVTAGPSGFETFYDSMGDAISGYDPAHLTKWNGHLSWRPMIIQTVNIKALLGHVGMDYDFVTIDVEGTNLDILQAMPWGDMPKVQMVCVEYDNKAPQMTDFMTQFGFYLVHRNGENLIFKRNIDVKE